MKKIKTFFKENIVFILVLVISGIIFNYPLDYYVSAPGGVIDIKDRIKLEGKKIKTDGSLNMLYVTEYNGTIGSLAIAKIMKNWDIEKIETKQIANESEKEINSRNKLLLNSSIQEATYVAYTQANKKIDVKSKKTIVLATTEINKGVLLSGDIIKEVDGKEIESTNDLKALINEKEVGDYLNFLIERDNKEKEIKVEIKEDKNKNKLVGIILYTQYDYNLDPCIDIRFKQSESGSSGGLMMALSIYNVISEDDIIKGRNIAGTGTISKDGTVGEIDGIKYKIMGAYKNKMDIVLVPKANYKEAQKINKKNNYKLKIVSIDTFEDAINYLKNN